MGRKFLIAKGRVGAAWDDMEQRARAKYLRARQLPGTNYVLTDAALYPLMGSAGLRAAADKALEVEMEASINAEPKEES